MTIVITIVCVMLQISVNLLTMQGLQSIIELNWGKFLVIALMKLCCWILNFLFIGLEGYFESKAIRYMNNDVRRDIAVTMTAKKTRGIPQNGYRRIDLPVLE